MNNSNISQNSFSSNTILLKATYLCFYTETLKSVYCSSAAICISHSVFFVYYNHIVWKEHRPKHKIRSDQNSLLSHSKKRSCVDINQRKKYSSYFLRKCIISSNFVRISRSLLYQFSSRFILLDIEGWFHITIHF